MDEARAVMSRLERIESLQREEAPAAALLAEVRHLLREGEAWLAAERGREDSGAGPGGAAGDRAAGERTGRDGTAAAAAALDGCRETLARREEVVPGQAGNAGV